MKINPESVSEIIKFLGIVLLVIINNHVKDELGVNQPRKTPEPGMLIECLEKQGIITERKCLKHIFMKVSGLSLAPSKATHHINCIRAGREEMA